LSLVTPSHGVGFFSFLFFYLLYLHNPCCGLCLPVIVIIFPSNVLRLIPTGKSYPPLSQEMQDAFRPEHMRQEAECARVDFPCSSLEQDLRKGKMMTMTLYPPQRSFCIVALAQPVLLLYYLFYFKVYCFLQEKQRKTRPPTLRKVCNATAQARER